MAADLLGRATGPLTHPIHAWLTNSPLPASVREALGLCVEALPLMLAAAIFAVIGLVRRRSGPVQPALRRAATLACTAASVLFGWWLARHPSEQFDDLFKRGDHLAFAGLVGLALEHVDSERRKWVLALVSVGLLLQYAGPLPLAFAAATSLAGLTAARVLRTTDLRVVGVVHAALLVLGYAALFRLRRADFFAAAGVQGLLAFWILRHVSLLVHGWRSGMPSAADGLAYLTFYPGAMGVAGAPEVFDEFSRRNLARRPPLDHIAATRRLAEGVLLVATSHLVPVSLESVEQSASAPVAWGFAVLFFVRIALTVTGIWRSVEVTALLYGVRLRANFAGLLTARNPSELWWAWRGTMTNWLVQHVYAPLGANRRHQRRNILAAFAVSFAWHALGVPFVSPEFRIVEVAAVGVWAGVNATAVVAHVTVSRTRLPAAAGPAPAWIRRLAATLSTWALGSLSPILLSYQGAAVERLPRLLRALLGLA